MASDDRTDRFRPVFEPEELFDRFVKNANQSSEERLPRDDEPTGLITTAHARDAHASVQEAAEKEPESREAAASARRADKPTSRPHARRLGVFDQKTAVRAAPSSVMSDVATAEKIVEEEVIDEVIEAPIEALIEALIEEEPDDDKTRPRARLARGGPPAWDHAITVKGAPEAVTVRAPQGGREGTRPDAPLAIARAFDSEELSDAFRFAADSAPTQPLDQSLEKEHPEEDINTTEAPLAKDDDSGPGASVTDSGQRILLLTQIKHIGNRTPRSRFPGDRPHAPAGLPDAATSTMNAAVAAELRLSTRPKGAPSLNQRRVRPTKNQARETELVVPDVLAASRKAETTYVGEGVEDGQVPTRELDKILSDMQVLLRYGHAGQVRDRLDQLIGTYPEDLLLMRRIAEFHVENDQIEPAVETLFLLAGGLFERTNIEGMRQALEQVLVLDPDNERAERLIGLLERRVDDDSI